MARKQMVWNSEAFVPGGPPAGVVVIEVPANVRAALTAIEVTGQGQTGASVPLTWRFHPVTDQGGFVDDSTNLRYVDPGLTENKLVKVYKGGSAPEPAGQGNPEFRFGLHQQASRVWIPPTASREIILPENTFWELQYRGPTLIAHYVSLYLEE